MPDVLIERRRWAVVALLFIASMVNYLDRASLSLALPSISSELGLDATHKGLLLSAFFWSYALLQIPIGLCLDRFPIRWLYAGMFALWSLACGLTGFAGTLIVFIGLRIVLGIGESIYFPGGAKTVSLLFSPKDRGLAQRVIRLRYARGAGRRRGADSVVDRVVWLAGHVQGAGIRFASVADPLDADRPPLSSRRRCRKHALRVQAADDESEPGRHLPGIFLF